MATGLSTRFFESTYYAVAGASSDPSKYGYKVLAWYISHSLPVTPLNPARPSITLNLPSGEALELPTLKSPSALPHPTQTSLSVITPPAVTRGVLREAKEAGVRAVWLQPGSFDEEGLSWARGEFETVVAGEGWCVLVDGEAGLEGAREKGKL